MRKAIVALLCVPLLSAGADAIAICGGSLGQNSWGRPLDFRSEKDREYLKIIEPFHFTIEVENLQRGLTSPLPNDIHYTLMRFLNHPRALNSMATWQLRNGFREGQEYLTVDCYFERAVAFVPDDPMVYLVWGNYLLRKKDYKQARSVYAEAERLDPENPEVHYNMGLLYIELGELDKAAASAERAYALGHPLPGLQMKLKRLGVKLKPRETQGAETATDSGASK